MWLLGTALGFSGVVSSTLIHEACLTTPVCLFVMQDGFTYPIQSPKCQNNHCRLPYLASMSMSWCSPECFKFFETRYWGKSYTLFYFIPSLTLEAVSTEWSACSNENHSITGRCLEVDKINLLKEHNLALGNYYCQFGNWCGVKTSGSLHPFSRLG